MANEHLGSTAPRRHLACASCGCEFTAAQGAEALDRKRRLEAGLTEDPNATHKAFLEKATPIAKVWNQVTGVTR